MQHRVAHIKPFWRSINSKTFEKQSSQVLQFRQQLTGFVTKVSHQSLLLLPMALGEYGTNESRKIKSLLVNKSERKEEKSQLKS